MNSDSKNNELPKGWKREEKIRKNGVNKGKTDIYVTSPKGKIFRSKKELANYIQEKKLPLKVDDFIFTTKKVHPNASLSKTLVSENSYTDTNGSEHTDFDESVGNCLEPRETVSSQTQTESNSAMLSICSELLSKQWISDNTLYKYFELYNRTLLSKDKCLIIDPAISHAVKNITDYNHFLDHLQLKNRDFFVVPINDSELLDSVGGSHWSVVIFHKQANTFYYYDSQVNYNLPHARAVTEKLIKHLDIEDSHPEFMVMHGAQQVNSYDCAIYTVIVIESFIQDILANKLPNISRIEQQKISENDLLMKRSQIAYFLNSSSDMTSKEVGTLLVGFIKMNARDQLGDVNSGMVERLELQVFNLQENVQFYINKITDMYEEIESINSVRDELILAIEEMKYDKQELDKLRAVNKLLHNEVQELKNFYQPDDVRAGSSLELPIQDIFSSLDNPYSTTQDNDVPVALRNISKSTNNKTKLPVRNYTENKSGDMKTSAPKYKLDKGSRQAAQHLFTIVADSHGRDLYHHVDNMLPEGFNVFSQIHPGAPLEAVVASLRNTTHYETSTKNDYTLVIGGTNSIDEKTTTSSLKSLIKSLENLVKDFVHTNLMLSTIPYRYDLRENCNTNQYIKEVNETIRLLAYNNAHIMLLDLHLLERRYHTRHGLHINKRGKKAVSQMILGLLPSSLLKSAASVHCLTDDKLSVSREQGVAEPTVTPIHDRKSTCASAAVVSTASPVTVSPSGLTAVDACQDVVCSSEDMPKNSPLIVNTVVT